ncbi:MAG: U32 family peptidase [Clostridia bacterium]|nr:U32 family peptidase [Clostridia bacterium]
MNKAEILAPAGDKNSVLAAVNAGANAVYLGLKAYSARSSAENFDYENFEEIARYCHALGVKVYVAMNTLVKDGELDDFIVSAVKAWNKGADAIILSDIFVGKFLKESCSEMVLHLSTQAGVCNAYGAKLAKEYGFSRVILARETAIEDIEEITKIIETEVFVQGALCTCFSGQCYLSSFAGGNSGNRGKCKQPCRKKYSIDREGFEESAYRLSLSDLSVGENIERLISAGVASFKIEGRMRRPEYVSAAVKYYVNLIDNCSTDSDFSDLKRTYNRGNYTKGLAFGQDKSFLSPQVQGHIGEFVGVIKVENGKFVCICRQNFTKGDGFKILRNGKEVGGASYLCGTKNGFVLSTKARLRNGDKVFITTDTALNARLLSAEKKLPVKLEINLISGKKAEIFINGMAFYGDKHLESAQNRPLTVEDIKVAFKKVDKYPFEVRFLGVNTDGVFMPASELNALRRTSYGNFYKSITENFHNIITPNFNFSQKISEKNTKVAAICTNLHNLNADIGILKLSDFNSDISALTKGFKGEKYLYIPPYLTGKEIQEVKKIIPFFDGIYSDGTYAIALAKELGIPLFAGTGFNISNRIDTALCKAEYIALSKELTVSEADKISMGNTFYLTAGDIKVMDLIYCPFEKKCASCDKRENYTLTDENGRQFPLRRYGTGACRFELYNCASLASETHTGALLDCTLQAEPQKLIDICKSGRSLREYFKSYTRGHSEQSVF